MMMLYQLIAIILSGLITQITRREVVYFKEQLKLKQIITPNFSECILCKISMGNKIGYITVTYRSPSQTASDFDNFLENFWKTLVPNSAV